MNAGTGRIYTCRKNPNGAAIAPQSITTKCDNKLTIKGALIAQRIVLERTLGTLGGANLYEDGSEPNVAEVVNFTPEFYLGKPAFKASQTKPDIIKSLPPTL